MPTPHAAPSTPTRLDLRDQGVDAAALAKHLADPEAARWIALDLAMNPLGPTGARVLAACRSLMTLAILDLSTTGLGDDGAAALSHATLPALRWLDLSTNGVGPEGAAHLARMTTLVELRALRFAGTADAWEPGTPEHFLGPEGAAALAGTPHLMNLEALALPLHALGDAGAAAIADSPFLTQLRRLDLSWNEVGDPGAAALLASPALAGLTTLDLRGSALSAKTRAALEARFGAGLSLDPA
ncbi:MAG: hypothetical protein H6739_33150 [Alphaproteobacteria bacterium]|nr:hypothetical protein [Alphaproteobacteria bacterium]